MGLFSGGGLFGGIGGMLGGALGSMFGPLGAQLGRMIGSAVGEMLGQLIGQFGQLNVQNAMTNNFSSALANGLKEAVFGSNLPTFIKDDLSHAIDMASSQAQLPTPSACQQGVDDAVGDAFDPIQKVINESIWENAKKEAKKGGLKDGENWLVILAKTMSEVQNEHLDKMLEASDTMRKSVGKSESARRAFVDAQGEFQAESKLFQMASEAASTAIKSVGDGLTSIARKG